MSPSKKVPTDGSILGDQGGRHRKVQVLEWGDIEWLKVRTQQWVRQATGSGGGIQSHKSWRDPGGVCKPGKAGHGTGAWNRVSNLVAGLPSSGKGPRRAICDLASAGRGQVHRQCMLESWAGGSRNKCPARYLLLISCLFAQVGRLCLNTLRGKGSQSQPNGVTGYPRWTRIHDHWQNWRAHRPCG